MTVQVHGGVFNDQVLTGDLRFFRIVGADFSGAIAQSDTALADVSYGKDGNGDPIPHIVYTNEAVKGSAAEIIFVLLSTRGLIAIMNPASSGLHFALDVNTGWNDAGEIQTVVRELGVSVGVDQVNVSAVNVYELEFELGVSGGGGGGGGGAALFTELTDTPETYVGSNNHSVVVNNGGTGIAFKSNAYIRITAVSTLNKNEKYFIDTTGTQTLPNYTGFAAGDFVRISKNPAINFELFAFAGQTIVVGNGTTVSSINMNKAVEVVFVYNGTNWRLSE